MSEVGLRATGPVPIGLGGSVFGWLITPCESEAVLDRFFEIGGRFIDTSDGYSHASRDVGGDSESIIGRWARRNGVADQLQICTKVGLCPGGEGLRAETVRTAVDRSRDRLGVEMFEAVLAHADDPTTPAPEIAHTLSSLRWARAHRVGVSGFATERLEAVLSAAEELPNGTLDVVQAEFNLADRSFESSELGRLCVSRGLGLMSTGSLAQGFLTGKFRNATERVGHRQQVVARRYRGHRMANLLDVLESVAARHDVSMAAAALAWLVGRPPVVLPLASVTQPDQLEAFREVGGLRLDDEDRALLDGAGTN
ncbi:aldo/keto reductase [Nocardioides sp. W7]|uniref:aldo/keto reductase n=1 Tax=Nocardioides sp. W7 TaxID=2931390 RepID=UPI001FD3D493|nr:aldo/keto reductase [Nocardioides sp. W7]